ncbi:MAG: septum site-determining protein MinC, partial [Clostridia bacterium]|nr:septum site-determining protein MinC [Clostridia bacterium]
GAELIAGGNVLVLGQLRGMVQAGACGNENAVIMAFRLKPMQLRIAGHITRAPDDDEADQDFPEIASIQNGVITIEPFV